MDIREVLSRPEYQFIQTNPHLGGSMLFATFGGSHAYGTNKPTSDIDIRGCAHQPNETQKELLLYQCPYNYHVLHISYAVLEIHL